MENLQIQEFYEFARFRLDTENRLLHRVDGFSDNAPPIALTLKEFEILLALIENAGRVVGKNDLLELIWKGVFVEEATLTRNISRLRKKLEAAGGGEPFIETLPGRGYRFLPPVVKRDAPAALVVEEKVRMLVRVFEEDDATERRGDGEMGRWGDGETGRRRDFGT